MVIAFSHIVPCFLIFYGIFVSIKKKFFLIFFNIVLACQTSIESRITFGSLTKILWNSFKRWAYLIHCSERMHIILCDDVQNSIKKVASERRVKVYLTTFIGLILTLNNEKKYCINGLSVPSSTAVIDFRDCAIRACKKKKK